MKRRYAVAISAMMVALPMADTTSAAEPSLEQLETIHDLLERNDVQELRSYLAAHPELLQGVTTLSQLLLQFLADSANMISFLGLDSTWGDDDPDPSPVVAIY